MHEKHFFQRIRKNLTTKYPILDLNGFEVGGTKVARKLIQYCTHLRVLKLDNAHLYNLSFLKNLVHLETLYLGESCLRDISVLGKLEKLKELYLDWNEIKNIDTLSELKQLQVLNLHGNQIEDIQVLSNLSELKELHLGSNPQIQDFSPLANLKKLKVLEITYCNLRIFALPEGLESLEELDLNHNKLKRLSLPKLEALQKLDVSNNQLKDLSFLSHIRALDELHLLINPIENIEFLKKIYGLSRFDVSLGKLDYPPISVVFLENQDGEIQDYIHLPEPPQVLRIWQLIKTRNTKNRDIAKQLSEEQGWKKEYFEAYVLFYDNNS